MMFHRAHDPKVACSSRYKEKSVTTFVITLFSFPLVSLSQPVPIIRDSFLKCFSDCKKQNAQNSSDFDSEKFR